MLRIGELAGAEEYTFGGVSGVAQGPDGRIYWSVGDMGLSTVTGDGTRHHYPNQGAVLRSFPDGSGFEVFAAGLRNTHEFDFDARGNLISVDNDGDHPGEMERGLVMPVQLYPMSPLGLVELSRQRLGPSLAERLGSTSPIFASVTSGSDGSSPLITETV